MDSPADIDLLELVPWLRREALAQGYDDRAIRRLVRGGEWHRVRRGAFIAGSSWAQWSPEQRHRVLSRAVLKTAHPTAVLSHLSAAVELGAPTYGVDLTHVHLTRTDGHPGRTEAGVVHHSGALSDPDILEGDGVRLVCAERAAVETATLFDVERSLVIINGLLHTGRTMPEGLAARALQMKHWPHSLRTDLVLRLADARLESVGESRTFYLCWAQGLPKPQPQYEVRDEQGMVVARCDFAWPEHGAFLEFDGRVKVEHLVGPQRSAADVLLAQQRREELICRLTGWVCIRLTWADLETPVATARRIRRLLESRRAAA